MTAASRAYHADLLTMHRALLTALACMCLLTVIAGRSGVQVLDSGAAARLAALHLHGIPGEASYVEQHRSPAPFVHDHCHAASRPAPPQPSQEALFAASTLAGAALCTTFAVLLAVPDATWYRPELPAAVPDGQSLLPALLPPR